MRPSETQAKQTAQSDSGEVLPEEKKVEQNISSYKKRLHQRRGHDSNARTREHPSSSMTTVWTEHEDKSLIQAHEWLGNNWLSVSKIVGTKTNQECRRRYNALEAKGLLHGDMMQRLLQGVDQARTNCLQVDDEKRAEILVLLGYARDETT